MHHQFLGVSIMTLFAQLGSAQSSPAAEEASIRTQLSAYAQARQGGDGHAQAAFYTDDADAWFSGTREMAKGQAEIGRDLNVASGSRPFRLEVEAIGFLGPDVALVDARYFSVSAEPNGHAFYVMVKRSGKWKIRAARIATFAPNAR
ncbi:MAG TPA: DUF4440 domain-containing protein [Gemmatimonadaceae bacterium]|nr:DUF4440 domain-containing protein [Gemmatimonadaceae bacterium]